MRIVNTRSLAMTLDAVNDALFYGRPVGTKAQKEQVAGWIASRQGKKGAYANMFAPTKRDLEESAKLFTGERVRSGAATGHILGQEASRALILLNITRKPIMEALKRAQAGIMERIEEHDKTGRSIGTYCCGTCTCAYWRHLAAGGLDNGQKRLAVGMKVLKSCRDGEGKWKRYPFYYTLLALSELDLPGAVAELRYAGKICERPSQG